MTRSSRRTFLKTSGSVAGALMFTNLLGGDTSSKVRLSGHLWIYASKFPPKWDSTPVLDQVFSDFKYAGMEGVEMMQSNLLQHADAVSNLRGLIEKYKIPVTGTSFYGEMWDQAQHQKILEDAELAIDRLHQLGGTNLGITVGTAKRMKTEAELDAQAVVLERVLKICRDKNVTGNLHNHTYEVENDLHDLKGTLTRLPEVKLGPDLNWLIRGGVDPVNFIRTYGKQMVYMHLRDQNKDGQWTEALGEGVTDFPAIARALKEVNFKGEAAIELASDVPPLKPMRENWKISRTYVKRVFGW
jgi:sugar phosphate isomerase/epimerase